MKTTVTARTAGARRADPESVPESVAYQECLEQAEICREQARAAARLKRFKAAYGLFETAIALCRRAADLRRGACPEASECLEQLNIEMLTYSELAKSMERPLVSRSVSPLGAHSRTTPHSPV